MSKKVNWSLEPEGRNLHKCVFVIIQRKAKFKVCSQLTWAEQVKESSATSYRVLRTPRCEVLGFMPGSARLLRVPHSWSSSGTLTRAGQ